MFGDEDKVEDKKFDKKEKVNTITVKKNNSGDLVKIRNRSGQRQTLNFKRTPEIRVNVGEFAELTTEQFESEYFKNRAKYFSVVKEA